MFARAVDHLFLGYSMYFQRERERKNCFEDVGFWLIEEESTFLPF